MITMPFVFFSFFFFIFFISPAFSLGNIVLLLLFLYFPSVSVILAGTDCFILHFVGSSRVYRILSATDSKDKLIYIIQKFTFSF